MHNASRVLGLESVAGEPPVDYSVKQVTGDKGASRVGVIGGPCL